MRIDVRVERMIMILIVCPNRLQTRLRRTVKLRDDRPRRHGIIDARKRDADSHQQAKRIDHDVPLSPRDFLAAVVSAAFTCLRAGNRFGIEATGTGELISLSRIGSADQLHDMGVQTIQPAFVSPPFEVIVDRALGQQVMRQHVPLTSGAGLVLNRVIHPLADQLDEVGRDDLAVSIAQARGQ